MLQQCSRSQISKESIMNEQREAWKQTRREFLDLGLRIVPAGLLTLLAYDNAIATESQRAVMSQDALALDREATAKRIEDELIAPCCFAQTVAHHYSDVAERIKQHIRHLLAQGATEQQILDAYVRVYGERILAEPLARGFNWLAYVLPPLAVVAGAGSVLLWLTRWRGAVSPSVTPAPLIGSSSGSADDSLRARLTEELEHFAG
jgi:cytochrome c-type biogenesis protein CcmH/NrfF